jgi:two-component system sensor histidine kinase/response regulator
MGGEIGLSSSKGVGTTFWFELPLDIADPTTAMFASEEMRNIRVLSVDDEPNSRSILNDYISYWGMESKVVDSGKEALRALRQAYVDGAPFHICIIDYLMPDKNGLELAAEIFADPAISKTKLVLLTAFDAPGLGAHALDSGFSSYLTKPVRQSQMFECVLDVLRGTQSIARSSIDAKLAQAEITGRRSEIILIAEDYAINQQVAQLYLDQIGFSSHVVSNGLEAVEAAKTEHYALILMDCQMPEMDGYAATEAIRNYEATRTDNKAIPIIAMTAHAMSGDRERCMKAGMDDYVSKPVDPETLKKVLMHWLPMPFATLSAETENPVELDIGRTKYGANADSLYKMFLEKIPLQMNELRQAIESREPERISRVAHGFKGICGTIIAPRMHNTCLEIENAVSEENWDLLLGLLARLDKEATAASLYLESRL